ncbi:hypothetical protein Tco_1096354, partial [Tanacetum coccineum]
MTRNRSPLINFVNKFLGTVRFVNDQIAKIMGYDDYQMGNVTISQSINHLNISENGPNRLLDNVIGNPSRPVSTRHQLQTEAMFCYFDAFLTFVVLNKRNTKIFEESCWVESMQEELNEFKRLGVWELVPPPDRVMIITLKWIFKVILDDLGVSAIVSVTSSSEYSSWSKNRSKSSDLDSSRPSVLKCFLDDQNSRCGSLKDSQYAVFNETEYAVLIFLNEYAVLDRKLDTP